MKLHRIVCLCAAIVLPQVSWAELTFTGTALATVQATIDFCAQTQAHDAKRFQEYSALLVRDASQEELAKIRDTSEYKAAYELISDELAKVTKEHAKASCRDLLRPAE